MGRPAIARPLLERSLGSLVPSSLLSTTLTCTPKEPTTGGKAPDEDSARKWINLNSFAARLLGKDLPQWTNYAIWQLRSALEEPDQDKGALDCEVMAAAEWILQGGEELYKRFREDLDEAETRMTKPGSLYQGKAGLCRQRWDFWKQRFTDVSQQVSEGVGKQALLAADRMQTIESAQFQML